MAMSDKPWSSSSAADYDIAQWKRACLIHVSDRDVKRDHKLPVKKPDGTLSRKFQCRPHHQVYLDSK